MQCPIYMKLTCLSINLLYIYFNCFIYSKLSYVEKKINLKLLLQMIHNFFFWFSFYQLIYINYDFYQNNYHVALLVLYLINRTYLMRFIYVAIAYFTYDLHLLKFTLYIHIVQFLTANLHIHFLEDCRCSTYLIFIYMYNCLEKV